MDSLTKKLTVRGGVITSKVWDIENAYPAFLI